MRTLLIAVVCTLFVAAAGCQSDDKGGGDMKKQGDSMKMSGDACSHCAGVQKATADGKCPMCGKKVDAASMSSSSADVCAACAGMQTATADNKCSACGAELAK